MSNRTPSCQDMAKVAPMKTFDTNPEKLPQVVNKEAVPAVSSVPFADIPHVSYYAVGPSHPWLAQLFN